MNMLLDWMDRPISRAGVTGQRVGDDYDVLGRLVRRTVNGVAPKECRDDPTNRVKHTTVRGWATTCRYDAAVISRTKNNLGRTTICPRITPLTLSAPATALQVGQSVLVTLSSSDPAGTDGLAVALSVTGQVSAPGSLTLPANQRTATFTVTATGEGAATVTATAPGRTPANLAFTVQPAFAITGLEPQSGPVGSPVAINGVNFDPDPGKNEVRFNGERAVVATASPTRLQVIVPIKATSGPVSVTTARGTAISPAPYSVEPLQGFNLALAPATIQIPRSGLATVRIKLVNAGLSAYTHGVTLQVSGLPAGMTARFEPAQLAAGADTILTLMADGSAPAGSHALTVSGTGPLDVGTATRSQPLALTVLDATATTVSGRVLHAEDDSPFVGARIRLGGQSVTTDETGAYRFVSPTVLGDQVLLVDGHTNASATTEYPSAIAVPVMIVAGQDNRAFTSYGNPPGN